MHTPPFHYHRAQSLEQASSMLQALGNGAKALAGGQSLIPLMKLRLARPEHLVDLGFIPGLAYLESGDGELRLGALARHAEIEASPLARKIPILHDCAAGIADAQVRNRGTLGGPLAEADPGGDWGAVLLVLDTELRAIGPEGERTIPLSNFFV